MLLRFAGTNSGFEVLGKHFCRGIDCDWKKAIMLRVFVNFLYRIDHQENVRL